MGADAEVVVFRLAYVPGVMPAKWVRTFSERRPGVEVQLVDCPAAEVADLVRSGAVDAALGRPGPEGESGLALIRLYDEVPVVVVPVDHVLTAVDELACVDLADEQVLLPLDDVLWPRWGGVVSTRRLTSFADGSTTEKGDGSATEEDGSTTVKGGGSATEEDSSTTERGDGSATEEDGSTTEKGDGSATERDGSTAEGGGAGAVETIPGTVIEHRPETTADAVELVAAGVGVLVVPMSLARLHHRRDLTYRPLVNGPVAPVGLLWNEPTSELVEEFIGVVRGRKAGSSRGQTAQVPKRSAQEKAAARRAALEASGQIPSRSATSKGGGHKRGAKTKGAGKPNARRASRRGGR